MTEQTAKQKTCEDMIDERLERRLAEFFPNFDDLKVCTDILDARDYDLLKEIREETKDPETGEIDEAARAEKIKEAAREAFEGSVNELHYGIFRTVKITQTVVLSGGGPSDEFEIDFDVDGDVIGGRYLYKDWYDGASRELTAEQAQELVDLLGIYERGASND